MTDHTDLSKYSSQPFEPDKSQTINKSFRGFSLSSPFLASAKHELIIPVKGQEE